MNIIQISQQDIPSIIFFCSLSLMLIIVGIALMRGKLTFMIAGLNTMSKANKARYDILSISKFVGKLSIFIAAVMLVIPVSIVFAEQWLFYVGCALIILIVIVATIYANTGKRFKK